MGVSSWSWCMINICFELFQGISKSGPKVSPAVFPTVPRTNPNSPNCAESSSCNAGIHTVRVTTYCYMLSWEIKHYFWMCFKYVKFLTLAEPGFELLWTQCRTWSEGIFINHLIRIYTVLPFSRNLQLNLDLVIWMADRRHWGVSVYTVGPMLTLSKNVIKMGWKKTTKTAHNLKTMILRVNL